MKKRENIAKYKGLGSIILIIAVSIVAFCIVFQVWDKNWDVPYVFSFDGIGAIITAQNLENGHSLWDVNALNAPHEYSLLMQDYILPAGIMKVLTLMFNNAGLAINAFLLLTYILTSIAMYCLLKKMEVSTSISIVGGVLYSFLPYHFFREAHFWLMGCYIIPIAIWIIIELLNNSFDNGLKDSFNKNYVICYIFALLLGLNGIYYSCMFLILFWLVAVLKIIKDKNCRHLFFCCLVSFFVILPIFIFFVLPLILSNSSEFNTMEEERNLAQIDGYALRPVLLLLPIPGHRIGLLNRFTLYMYENLGINSEIYTANLGLVMSIGFVVSLISLLVKKGESKIKNMGVLNFLSLIVACVGGANVLIGVFVTSTIRCYNRISVFIACFSMVSFCCIAQFLANKFKQKNGKNYIIYITCCLILVIGIFDQTSVRFSQYTNFDIEKKIYTISYEETEDKYMEYKNLTKQIQEYAGNDAMVLQLPLVHNKSQFIQSEVVAVSEGLRWSSTISKNQQYEWLNRLNSFSLDDIFTIAKEVGFSGILIEADCYDEYSQYEEVDKKIEDRLGKAVYELEDENVKYYDLSNVELEISNTQDCLENLDDLLFSNNIIVSKECLRYQGNEENEIKNGELQYGPYYSLAAGEYKISIYGKNLSNSKVWSTIDCGQQYIQTKNVSYNDNVITYDLYLEKDADNVEFLFENHDRKDAYIDYYIISNVTENDETYLIQKEFFDMFY